MKGERGEEGGGGLKREVKTGKQLPEACAHRKSAPWALLRAVSRHCHLPSGSLSKERLRMQDLQHGVAAFLYSQ